MIVWAGSDTRRRVGTSLLGGSAALAIAAVSVAVVLFVALRYGRAVEAFINIFFVFFGLQTDPSALPPVAGLAFLLAVAGIATKYTTGWLAARRAGIGPSGRARAGAALIPRGDFNIVIAGLAVAAGAHASVGPLAAAYVLILAVTAPLAARAVEPLLRRHRTRTVT